MKSNALKKRDGGTSAAPRVYIRAPSEEDCDEFVALMRASARLHRGMVKPPTRPAAFAEYLERCRRPDFVGLLACRADDGRIVGVFNLSEIVRGNFQSAYLGYYVGGPFARRGYMTEALRLVLHHAFVRMKLHRVEANIQPDNAPSIRLAARAGFVREGYSRRYLKVAGRWRDHERWALLAEDWRERQRTK